jgi:hypothetical protein
VNARSFGEALSERHIAEQPQSSRLHIVPCIPKNEIPVKWNAALAAVRAGRRAVLQTAIAAADRLGGPSGTNRAG